MGELAALGAALCWAVAPVLFTLGGRTVSGTTINRLRLVPACLLLFVTHYWMEGWPVLTGAGSGSLIWLAISGILGLALGDTCLLKGFLLIGPRLVTLVMTLVPLMSALLAWVVFGEQFTLLEVGGASLCLLGVGYVVFARSHKGPHVEGSAYRKGLLFALGGALGQTLGLITAKQGLSGEVPVITAVLVRMVAAMLFMWLLQGFGKHMDALKALTFKAFVLIMAGAAIGPFLGVWLSIIAIEMTRVGMAATLMATTPILILPIAHFVLGERITWRAVIGAVVALSGIVLIIQ